jgi:chemotaxis protein MotA
MVLGSSILWSICTNPINVPIIPIAGKLKTRSKEEMLTKEMTIQGIISLSNGDNPRILEQKLLAFIPPNKEKDSK